MKTCQYPNCPYPVFTHGYCLNHRGQYYMDKIKKSIAPIQTETSIGKLKTILWDVFSAFIRLRDSDGDIFTCISCGRPKPIYYNDKQGRRRTHLHAGHYHKSEMSAALRYDEKNVNGQCYDCNMNKEGNRQGYMLGIIKKYGQNTLQYLDIKKNNRVKWGRFEYIALIKEYEQKLKELKKKKAA